MPSLRKGRYRARPAETDDDLQRALDLRQRAFRANPASGSDADAFDPICRHVLIEEGETGRLVACFRLLPIADGRDVFRTYSAQHYDLSRLEHYKGRMAEMGRFCLKPGCHDPDILRIAWGAMAGFVDTQGIEMLFGCASFAGTDVAPYRDAFAMLNDRHLAPRRWLPGVKAANVVSFAPGLRGHKPDLKHALKTMPPLLRTYLTMGGRVSDHGVIDDDLDTIHVFAGLEIHTIPSMRAQTLRGVAKSCP